jgi:hypothetical protein
MLPERPAQNTAKAANNRGIGRPFVKGVSGNPGGRPKGLVAAIRKQTRDGEELVTFMLRVFRGEADGVRLRDQLRDHLRDLLDRLRERQRGA